MQPLVCERPLYSLCTCVTRIRAVLPRTRTGSVGVTSRWQTADGRCSERPLRLQQSRHTSSDRSQRADIFRMYPYPSYGAAGPVSGGLQGRQGRVQNPIAVYSSLDGKGLNPPRHRLQSQVSRVACKVGTNRCQGLRRSLGRALLCMLTNRRASDAHLQRGKRR